MSTSTIRLGAGAGFSGDRIDPAVELLSHANLDYLIFECLGERTVAAGELRRQQDPDTGFDPLLEARMRACLPLALKNGTRIITNSGAANPMSAARVVAQVAREVASQRSVRIAIVLGDETLHPILDLDPIVWETQAPISASTPEPTSAHAYLGVEKLLSALESDADVIITGRVADPSLYLAPMIYEFGWSTSDFHLMGAGTAVGHLLECAGQLTGGYYADPLTKPVENLASLGFPFADVAPDGTAILRKLPQSGGMISTRTCTEQLLYEVSDPGAYITPDVVADFSAVSFTQVEKDAVKITGATGAPRTDTLKVTLGYKSGFLGEGQISYAGPRALERAELAASIVKTRLQTIHGIDSEAINIELIGAGSSFRGLAPYPEDVAEVRLRVAAIVDCLETAQLIGWEVESLYTNGPAAGGGARQSTKELLAIRSTLIPRSVINSTLHIEEVSPQ